jgi:hypothetical protein
VAKLAKRDTDIKVEIGETPQFYPQSLLHRKCIEKLPRRRVLRADRYPDLLAPYHKTVTGRKPHQFASNSASPTKHTLMAASAVHPADAHRVKLGAAPNYYPAPPSSQESPGQLGECRMDGTAPLIADLEITHCTTAHGFAGDYTTCDNGSRSTTTHGFGGDYTTSGGTTSTTMHGLGGDFTAGRGRSCATSHGFGGDYTNCNDGTKCTTYDGFAGDYPACTRDR